MTTQEIHAKLSTQFGDKIGELSEGPDPSCVVVTEAIAEVCAWASETADLTLKSLMCLSSTDDKENLGVVYNLHSMEHNHRITLKVVLTDRDNARVPTISGTYGTADWHEREAYDMMGIVFEGHPDLRRLLCPDDWEGWPLRKDYKAQEYYRGLRVAYPEGQDPDRGHWVSRDVAEKRAVAPERVNPDLSGM
jgi:NADH-quinone oxidoreductase subunit C